MQQYLTYQHNVQRYFRDHSDKYDGVIIPLSIATAFPSGTYGFIRCLCAGRCVKHYAIDPRNALFQKHWAREKAREPHKRMASALGAPYVLAGMQRAIQPSDFSEEAVLEDHVKQCIDFQLQFRAREEDARKIAKYKKLLNVQALGDFGPPQFLIPPYFQFTDFSDPWYLICQRSIELAMKHRKSVPVWPVLHFNDWLSLDWTQCHLWMRDQGVEQVWYYPNLYKEHEAIFESLAAYRNTISRTHEIGIKPNILFGGYFAILMSYYNANAFSNGIGYGEWRDSGYHKGGTALTRVYLLKLHRYVDAPVAQSLIDKDPDYFGSDTEIVAGYVDTGRSVAQMSLSESHDHFLECRRAEIDFVQTRTVPDAISELKETIDRLKALGMIEYEKFGRSLGRWSDVLAAA